MRYSCCQTVTDEGVRTSDRVRCQNEDTVQSFVVDSCCQTLTDEGVRTSDRVRCQTDEEMVPKLTDRLRKICVFAGAASKAINHNNTMKILCFASSIVLYVC